jgi:hypothetical protein
MEITIVRKTTDSKSIFGNDEMKRYTNIELDEFRLIEKEFEKIAELTNAEFKTESENTHETRINDARKQFHGGGVDIYNLIELIALYTGSIATLLKILKLLAPLVEKFIEKRAGRQITIKVDGIEVSVENKADLDLAIEKIQAIRKVNKNKK